jgi:hypothetical protein
MPSAQDCAERLREQAYRTLLPQIRELEQDLQSVNSSLSAGYEKIGRKLESLRQIELPTTELILGEILGEFAKKKDIETSALTLFMRGLFQRETQEEILSLLLDGAHQYYPRVALFVIRGDRLVGWSSKGFPEGLAGNISACSFVRSELPQFQEAIEADGPVTASDLPEGSPIEFLKEQIAGQYDLLPLKVMRRPVALLLAGGAEAGSRKPDELAIMAGFVALRLENIALKILHEFTATKPKPVPQPTRAPEPMQVPGPIPAAEPLPVPKPIEEAVAEPVVPPDKPEPSPAIITDERAFVRAIEEEVPPEPVAAIPLGAPQEAASEAEAESFATYEEPRAIPVTEHAEAPAPLPEAPKIPPQEIRPVPEEEKLHSEAKRFARLLVSEIKLYNEHHVVEGRGNRDLYLRLKRDIDRSREMYEKRISPIVSRKIDYFHDEIVRILGDNDPSTLGSDYPGPRVDS